MSVLRNRSADSDGRETDQTRSLHTLALIFKRTVEQAVLRAHPEWAGSHVGEEVSALCAANVCEFPTRVRMLSTQDVDIRSQLLCAKNQCILSRVYTCMTRAGTGLLRLPLLRPALANLAVSYCGRYLRRRIRCVPHEKCLASIQPSRSNAVRPMT